MDESTTDTIGLVGQTIDTGLPISDGGKMNEIRRSHIRWVLMGSFYLSYLDCLLVRVRVVHEHGKLGVEGAEMLRMMIGKRILISMLSLEVYTYEYWIEGWSLGIMEGGEREEEIYKRMLLVADVPRRGLQGNGEVRVG